MEFLSLLLLLLSNRLWNTGDVKRSWFLVGSSIWKAWLSGSPLQPAFRPQGGGVSITSDAHPKVYFAELNYSPSTLPNLLLPERLYTASNMGISPRYPPFPVSFLFLSYTLLFYCLSCWSWPKRRRISVCWCFLVLGLGRGRRSCAWIRSARRCVVDSA
ncbi:hypothetical protein VTI28DRAFT_10236 [Corynascus sepedonium]